MKITLINTLYEPNVVGGAERSVQFLAESLVSLGNAVSVVSTTPEKHQSMSELNGVKVHYVPLANVFWQFDSSHKSVAAKALWRLRDANNVQMARRLGAILDIEKPDVIHTNNLSGFSTAAWSQGTERNIPIVHTIRDYYLLCARTTMYRNGSNCQRRCLDCRVATAPKVVASNRVDAVVGNSRYVLDRHLEAGAFAKSRRQDVIYNAYSITGENMHRRGEGNGRLRIGFLGRLKPTKGIEDLLGVVSGLPQDSCELLVAGTGDSDYESSLKTRFDLPHIGFLGFVPPERLLASVDLVAIPSRWHEPLPRAAFEAYAHGLPVVASNRGGIPEVVDEGSTGFIYDPDHLETLRDILMRFVENPLLALKMRASVLSKAKKFHPSQTGSSYLDLYRDVAMRDAA